MNKNKPLIYQNREKSLLNFNHRVLSFAENQKIPLIERFKYVCIVVPAAISPVKSIAVPDI